MCFSIFDKYLNAEPRSSEFGKMQLMHFSRYERCSWFLRSKTIDFYIVTWASCVIFYQGCISVCFVRYSLFGVDKDSLLLVGLFAH